MDPEQDLHHVESDNEEQDFEETDDEDDAFEPVREAGKPAKYRKRELGPPITIDEKLDSLDENHRMVVEDFVHHAKSEMEKIVVAKRLSCHPFTNSVLREMAINFPQNETAMLDIQGIDPDKVHRYGKYLMNLIRTTEQGYYAMRDQEDRPHDPNHQHVVVISDDEDNNDNRDFEDFEREPASQEEKSAYFEPPAEVRAFNAELAQVRTIRSPAQAPQENRGRKGARGRFRGSFRGESKSSRRSSSGANKGKASNDGVKKKAFGSRSHSGSFGHNTGGFGRGGIGMMPT